MKALKAGALTGRARAHVASRGHPALDHSARPTHTVFERALSLLLSQ